MAQSVISKPNNTPDQQKSEFKFSDQIESMYFIIAFAVIQYVKKITNYRSMISQYITFVVIQYMTAT